VSVAPPSPHILFLSVLPLLHPTPTSPLFPYTTLFRALDRPLRRAADASECVDGPVLDTAIRIDDDDNLRIIGGQAAKAKVECKPFTAVLRVVPPNDLGTAGERDLRGVVAAIVRHDEQAIT